MRDREYDRARNSGMNGGDQTYVTVYSINHVLGWQGRDLRVDFDDQVGELLDEGFPFFLSETEDGFCRRGSWSENAPR